MPNGGHRLSTATLTGLVTGAVVGVLIAIAVMLIATHS